MLVPGHAPGTSKADLPLTDLENLSSCLMSGVTMDAGGLIALDRDDRRVVVLLARARETGGPRDSAGVRPGSGHPQAG